MLHTHLSPAHAGGSNLRSTGLLALFASAALVLSAGCSPDGSTPTGPGAYSGQIESEERPDRSGPDPTRRRPPSSPNVAAVHPGLARPSGAATQISGIGHFAEPGQCDDPEGQGSDYALTMAGDLEGCVYVFVESARCTPGETYIETGTETFVGRYNGAPGTFRTTYLYTAKYRDCANLAGQIAGRCQHPIVAGSGVGAFEGVIGRFDMTDDVEAGDFPYRGHLRIQG